MQSSCRARSPRLGSHPRHITLRSLLLSCFVAAFLIACGDDSADANVDDGGPPTDGPAANVDGDADGAAQDGHAATDAPIPDSAADQATSEPELVEVSHKREMRGVWIATVSRINWPKSSVADQQRGELDALLDAAKSAGINAVFFQVRPEADALYRSTIEPWSRYLTGTQGTDPGYDPLTYAIEGARKRGLELHAWLNPYRAKAGNVGPTAPNHVTHTMPEAVVTYGKFKWLDPGHPRAFDHTLNVIKDILTRYDIDGIHFDDYFYPYPESGAAFNDDPTFAAHGGGMSRGDWRRDNVNRMIKAVHDAVRDQRPDVRWGISPFGIYRNGVPAGITGLDQYAELYADPVKWIGEKWVEYVAPQLYWKTTAAKQSYTTLLGWWDAQCASAGRRLFPGNSAERNYGLAEYRAELDAVRSAGLQNTAGELWWSVRPIKENREGLADMLRTEYYHTPAATPALADAPQEPPQAPTVTVNGQVASVSTAPQGLRYWALYKQQASAWQITHLVPAQTADIPLTAGTWAISAIDRVGRESLGVVVRIGEGTTDPGPGPEPPPQPRCTHSFGGVFVHGGCTPSYQCCAGTWKKRPGCGDCVCEEGTGTVGCGT